MTSLDQKTRWNVAVPRRRNPYLHLAVWPCVLALLVGFFALLPTAENDPPAAPTTTVPTSLPTSGTTSGQPTPSESTASQPSSAPTTAPTSAKRPTDTTTDKPTVTTAEPTVTTTTRRPTSTTVTHPYGAVLPSGTTVITPPSYLPRVGAVAHPTAQGNPYYDTTKSYTMTLVDVTVCKDEGGKLYVFLTAAFDHPATYHIASGHLGLRILHKQDQQPYTASYAYFTEKHLSASGVYTAKIELDGAWGVTYDLELMMDFKLEPTT